VSRRAHELSRRISKGILP